MRTPCKLFTVFSFIVVLVFAGCTSSESQTAPTPMPTEKAVALLTELPTAVPEPTVDPAATIVLKMIAHANAEDYAGAAALVSEDMMAYFVGMPPTGMEIYRGRAQFQTFLEECCTGQNFVWEVMPERVQDGVVFAASKTWMDFTRELGVAPNKWQEIFVVKDGLITLYVSTITEEAWANFKPALSEVLPELFAVAPPADETPASEVTFTISDGTCAYSGPMTLQAGELIVNINAQDQKMEKYAVSLFTIDEDKDMFDLMASTPRPGPPPWSQMVFLKELEPNESQTYEGFYIEEGLLYMVCWAGPPDIPIGNAGPFYVQP